MTDDKIRLSRLDRLFLSNQMKILEALYPREAEAIAVQREAVERGYEILYGSDMDHIYDGDDVMTEEESREVWDTLSMFDAINRFIKNADDVEIKERNFTKFSGYDGNDESKFMAFSAYTVERLRRFAHVPLENDMYWNSHRPMREIYGRMLSEWYNVPKERRFALSTTDVKKILDAASAWQ